MAINLDISDNRERIPLSVQSNTRLRSVNADNGSPYYVGARAYVTQTDNGAVVTVIDKDGTTTATILNGQDGLVGRDGIGITSITQNLDGTLTINLDDGTSYDTEPLKGEDGYTPVKGVDYFDGEDGQDGYTPVKGVDYFDGANGQDGYTPIKGVDYFDGEDGQDGQDGYTPVKGVDYFDGAKGDTGNGIISTTLNADYTLTILFSDGTSVTTSSIRGAQGETGATGNGIANIAKTSTSGLIDTYTITYTNGATDTFQVKNGENGSGSVADVWVDGASVLDGDTAKIDLSGKADTGDIPTAVSELANDAGYITDYTETDPVFLASAAHGISSSDISNWNDKISSPNIPYLTCATAAGTAAKTTTLVSGTLPTTLTAGMQVAVKFTNSNTAANPTLTIGSYGAKSIKRYGTTSPSTSAVTSWNAGNVIIFVYDGTYWQMADWTTTNTTYSAITQANIENASGTTAGLITGQRAAQAVAKHESVSDVTVGGTSVMNGKVAEIPAIPTVPTNVSDFVNDAGYITGYTETDPTVPSWAKQASKPTYTASEVGALPSSTAIPSATSDLTNDSGFLNASGILNLFYPVGSYYETSDTAFDPNVSWGGTWTLETEGQVHISSGTNYTVAGALTNTTDGGESTVTLTVNEIPSHRHSGSTLGWSPSNAGGGSAFRAVTDGNTNYTGGGQAHNNMQPYIIVNRWHRTA